MREQPDILLVVLDTLRADHLSCYGYRRHTTPNLDRLARNSTLFKRAISPAQWTVPAHTSLFTGRYPYEIGVKQLNSKLPADVSTLAERLAAVGYHTAGFSNNPLVGILPNGLTRGFDRFINYGGLLTNSRESQSSGSTRSSPLTALQKKTMRNLQRSSLLFSPFILPIWHLALGIRGNLKGNPEGTLSDVLQFFRQRPREKPLFGFINLMGAHLPFYPTKNTWPDFLPELSNRAVGSFKLWQLNNKLYQLLGVLPESFSPVLRKKLIDLYDAEIAAQDYLLGIFLSALFREQGSKNLMIVIVADHGEMLGEDQLFGHAFTAAEPLIHIPLIIWDKEGRFPAGQVRGEPVTSRRIFHTLCTIGGSASVDEAEGSLWNVEPSAQLKEVEAVAVPLQSAMNMVERRYPGLVSRRKLDHTWIVRYQAGQKTVEIMKDEEFDKWSARRNLSRNAPTL